MFGREGGRVMAGREGGRVLGRVEVIGWHCVYNNINRSVSNNDKYCGAVRNHAPSVQPATVLLGMAFLQAEVHSLFQNPLANTNPADGRKTKFKGQQRRGQREAGRLGWEDGSLGVRGGEDLRNGVFGLFSASLHAAIAVRTPSLI